VQSENPTKPPPPNRVFSLLGGFFCCYGWFRLSLSLASSSFPEPHGIATKAEAPAKKTDRDSNNSNENEIINKKTNDYSVGGKRHKSADSLAKGQQHTSNTFKAAAMYKRSQKAMTTGSAVFLFLFSFFTLFAGYFRWLSCCCSCWWFVSFSVLWLVRVFFFFSSLFLELADGNGFGFFTSLPWRRLWVPNHRTRFAWFRPETCL